MRAQLSCRLERIVEDIGSAEHEPHAAFRLWLTASPSMSFPQAVLQVSLQLSNEPHKGLRANLTRIYAGMSDAAFENLSGMSAGMRNTWKKLLFGLSFFHASLQERQSFGKLGWNRIYDFSQADLECAMMNIGLLVAGAQDPENISWKAIAYVVGEVNYGGRVTDAMDRRCLQALLQQLLGPHIVKQFGKARHMQAYNPPADGSLSAYR